MWSWVGVEERREKILSYVIAYKIEKAKGLSLIHCLQKRQRTGK